MLRTVVVELKKRELARLEVVLDPNRLSRAGPKFADAMFYAEARRLLTSIGMDADTLRDATFRFAD